MYLWLYFLIIFNSNPGNRKYLGMSMNEYYRIRFYDDYTYIDWEQYKKINNITEPPKKYTLCKDDSDCPEHETCRNVGVFNICCKKF